MKNCLNPSPGCPFPAPPMGGNLFISELGKLYLRNHETNLWHYVSLGFFNGFHSISVESKGQEKPNETLYHHTKKPSDSEIFAPIRAVEAFFNQDGYLYLKSKFTGSFYLIEVEGPENALQLTVSDI